MSSRNVIAWSFMESAVLAKSVVAIDTSPATDEINSTLREISVLVMACSSLPEAIWSIINPMLVIDSTISPSEREASSARRRPVSTSSLPRVIDATTSPVSR